MPTDMLASILFVLIVGRSSIAARYRSDRDDENEMGDILKKMKPWRGWRISLMGGEEDALEGVDDTLMGEEDDALEALVRRIGR